MTPRLFAPLALGLAALASLAAPSAHALGFSGEQEFWLQSGQEQTRFISHGGRAYALALNTSNPDRPRALRCQSAPLRHGEALIDGAVVSFHPRHGHINDSPPLPYTRVMTNLASYASLCPGLGLKR